MRLSFYCSKMIKREKSLSITHELTEVKAKQAKENQHQKIGALKKDLEVPLTELKKQH